MIPSYFKIEILTIRDELVTLGHKGLRLVCLLQSQCSGAFASGHPAAEPPREAAGGRLLPRGRQLAAAGVAGAGGGGRGSAPQHPATRDPRATGGGGGQHCRWAFATLGTPIIMVYNLLVCYKSDTTQNALFFMRSF